MRPLFATFALVAAILASPARADPGDCATARAALPLARRYGLDLQPYWTLVRRACPRGHRDWSGPQPSCSHPAPGAHVYRLAETATAIFNVPDGTRVLVAAGSRISSASLINLPDKLVALNVSHTPISSTLNVPDSVVALDLSRTRVTSLMNLPPKLRYLDIRGTRATNLQFLPSTIECVVADRNISGPAIVYSPEACGIHAWWMRYMSR